MSVLSTIRVTRSKARLTLMQFVARATDEELEELMDPLLRKSLYNCRIVSDHAENEDERVHVDD